MNRPEEGDRKRYFREYMRKKEIIRKWYAQPKKYKVLKLKSYGRVNLGGIYNKK